MTITVGEPDPAPSRNAATNEALLIADLVQHELAETAEKLNEQLRAEIVERKLAENALRQSEERYRTLFDLDPIAIYACDISGLIRECNRTAVELWGHQPKPGDTHDVFCRSLRLHSPDGTFIPHELCPMADMLSGKLSEVRDREVHIERPDGTRVFVIVNIRLLKNEYGEITGAINCFVDITERKRAEEALRASERKYRALFDAMDEGFCIIEKVRGEAGVPLNFRYVEANAAFEKQSGVGHVVGKTIRQMFAGVTEDWYETYDKILTTGESVRFERALTPDERILELYAFRVEDESHRRVAVIFKDVTARKCAEAALLEATAAAEKANRAKSDFISGVSHELRTPLNAILGFAQLMASASSSPTPAQQRNLEQIQKAGWYLIELINEILDLALIESGKTVLLHEPVSLAAVMLECHAMVEAQAQTRAIGMSFPRFEPAMFVQADGTRVKQVLINLLFNAIKYNKPGGTVAVACALMPQDRVRISVRDTGAGLTPEQLAQLFQPFNRLGKEAGAEEGTGIGLVVTKRLVELMGGAIGVESTVGTGSVFWFELSVATPPEAAARQAEPASPAPTPVTAGPLLSTLLYVEDNPANLELVEQLIARRTDLRLLCAPDAILGIEYARADLPAVILMDINLPGINGIDALNILHADPSTAHIPIVALSANAMPRDIEKGLKAGFFRYLTKPIKINEFMDTLDVALKFAASRKTHATIKENAR